MIDIMNVHCNTWSPSELSIKEIEACLNEVPNEALRYLVIFKTEPFIDTVLVVHEREGAPVEWKRFVFHEDYAWTCEEEDIFQEYCLNNEKIEYTYVAIDAIYDYYSEKHPEWHLKRYYTKKLRILDHIYHCMKKGTAKEMLYKSGLDELAVNFEDIDEYNLLSSKPTDLYEGITIRTLRALNCRYGAELLKRESNRKVINELQRTQQDLFSESLNDAQCRYLQKLIENKLTTPEIGRLFKARCGALSKIWINAQYEIFLGKEKMREDNLRISKALGAVDPMYQKYFNEGQLRKNEITTLMWCLIENREEYDAKIRKANRKRNADWQERDKGYIVRFPQTINDFCKEAVYMRNCLLGYIDAFINNDTDILFLRETNDVNQPFITMEVYHGELMQAYHRFNESCTAQELEWIADYCNRYGIGCRLVDF